jgi:hypothetical protein
MTAIVDTLSIVIGSLIIALVTWGAKGLKNGVKDMHEVKVILVGRDPSKFEPFPPEGMIKTVADHGNMLKVLMKASRASLTDNENVTGRASEEAVRQIDAETVRQSGAE